MLLALLLAALVALPVFAQEEPVVVGSKKFTESVILAHVAAQWLEHHGIPAEVRAELGGSRFLFTALETRDIDVYPEYTGTIRYELLASGGPLPADSLRPRLRDRGLRMTPSLGFENTYAVGMQQERARELGITTISDLRDHPELALGFTNEFIDRSDGWPALRRAYRLPHEEVTGLDHDLAYRALDQGSVDAIDLYSTDANIAYYDLAVLADDRGHFPSYEALFLYRISLDQTHPQADSLLRLLAGTLGAERMRAMNAAVKVGGTSEARVAAEFLGEVLGRRSGGASVRQIEPIEEETVVQRIWKRTGEHLALVGISLLLAVLIAVPLGIVAAKRRRWRRLILGFVDVAYTIPALALLVFMIPLFGIGTLPAIAALFLYSLLPIVRNTYSGLAGIPVELRESARALGLAPGYRLRRIELPLAMRSILTGIQTAAVINVGTATLGALIGAGGYGQPILTGIRLDDTALILEGAVPAALLAIAAQGAFAVVERVGLWDGRR